MDRGGKKKCLRRKYCGKANDFERAHTKDIFVCAFEGIGLGSVLPFPLVLRISQLKMETHQFRVRVSGREHLPNKWIVFIYQPVQLIVIEPYRSGTGSDKFLISTIVHLQYSQL